MAWLILGVVVAAIVILGLIRAANWLIGGNHWEGG